MQPAARSATWSALALLDPGGASDADTGLILSCLSCVDDQYPVALASDGGDWVAAWLTIGQTFSTITVSTGVGPDQDGDGLSDGVEAEITGTDPLVADTDGDGLDDGAEVDVYGTDPLQADTDGDQAPDGTEVAYGTDPLDSQSFPWTVVPTLPWTGVVALCLLLGLSGVRGVARAKRPLTG